MHRYNNNRIGNDAVDKECFLQRFYEKTRQLTPAQIAQALHDVREGDNRNQPTEAGSNGGSS